MPKLSITQTEKFWSCVSVSTVPDECWNWIKSRTGYGYGQITFDNVPYYAHRLAYEISYNVELEKGIYVCHTCDNPRCVNPKHLFLGSPQDNMNDKYKKLRGKTLFTESQVSEIKAEYEAKRWRVRGDGGITTKDLAVKYDVAQGTIKAILRGDYCPGFGPKPDEQKAE